MVSNAKETSSLDLSDRLTAALGAHAVVLRSSLVLALGSVVLDAHRPDPIHEIGERGEVVGVRRWECAGHFDAREEQHAWPCDQVEALARVLGVDL